MFIAVAVVGSLLLTNVARSAPLAGAWTGVSGGLVERLALAPAIPPVGRQQPADRRRLRPDRDHDRGGWHPNNDLVATIKLPVDDKQPYYWRAATYDEFILNGWRASTPDRTERAVDAPLVAGTRRRPTRAVAKTVTFTVLPASGSSPILLSPLTPTTVDQPTNVNAGRRPGGYLGSIERRSDGVYTVKAQIRTEGDDPGQLSVAALEGAGTDYPPDIERLYGAEAVPDGRSRTAARPSSSSTSSSRRPATGPTTRTTSRGTSGSGSSSRPRAAACSPT